jgi:hypothetical protein
VQEEERTSRQLLLLNSFMIDKSKHHTSTLDLHQEKPHVGSATVPRMCWVLQCAGMQAGRLLQGVRVAPSGLR